MDNHECIIGMFHLSDDSENITLNGLYDWMEFYESCELQRYTLADYFDGRKSTNLSRYKYCPECGKKINWKQLRGDVKHGHEV